jgi:hypothetical protein
LRDGTKQTKHGMYGTPTYSVWRSMIKRCYQTNTISYASYGACGISVCERWRKFINFYIDMGPRPGGHTLDRIENSGNYEPDNCRWATREQQSRNRRCARLLTFNGETLNLVEWATRRGIRKDTLQRRLDKYKWPIEKALITPVQVQVHHRRVPSGIT